MLNVRSQKIRFAALALAAAASLGAPSATGAQEPRPRIRAPELDGAEAWVTANQTEGQKPLRLADLKGKVVLLDFWTYG